jgi:hypothetical protein
MGAIFLASEHAADIRARSTSVIARFVAVSGDRLTTTSIEDSDLPGIRPYNDICQRTLQHTRSPVSAYPFGTHAAIVIYGTASQELRRSMDHSFLPFHGIGPQL